MLVTIAASFVLSLPFADVCLTPASRGGDVGQAPVPSLDAQVVESRRGPARRVAGFLFFLSSPSLVSLLLRGFLAFLRLGLSSQKFLQKTLLEKKKISKPLLKKP